MYQKGICIDRTRIPPVQPFWEGSDPTEYNNLTIFRRANSLSYFAHFNEIFEISSTLSFFCQVACIAYTVHNKHFSGQVVHWRRCRIAGWTHKRRIG